MVRNSVWQRRVRPDRAYKSASPNTAAKNAGRDDVRAQAYCDAGAGGCLLHSNGPGEVVQAGGDGVELRCKCDGAVDLVGVDAACAIHVAGGTAVGSNVEELAAVAGKSVGSNGAARKNVS